MGWEYRVFWKGHELQVALVEAMEQAGITFGLPKSRTDVYYTTNDSCGLKLRKLKKWEVKLRKSIFEHQHGNIELWHKTEFAKDVEPARAFLAQHSVPSPDFQLGIATHKQRQKGLLDNGCEIESTLIDVTRYDRTGDGTKSSDCEQWYSIAIEHDDRTRTSAAIEKLHTTLLLTNADFCGGYPAWLELTGVL
eukprot:TRINITY_DN5661_c0_g1_i1.p1 TRINITY_DN5661_c0_g1~~TRINITY_DN5661_c0_g1_i1.p1  ORF type:complete len:193 (+),score=22.86 TRINITY_DN5661_c0_g1_i1:108-686(+)